MQKEQLLELRNKIVQSTQEIALRGEGDASERLQVLLGMVRSGDAGYDVLAKSFELAQSIEGDDDKLTALLDILFEVDAKLSADESQHQPDEQQESEEQNQHE